MPQISCTTVHRSRLYGPACSIRARAWMHVDVPQPSPDIVPLPPSPHPIPPSPALPPEITEPTLPGQNEPVREPGLETPWPMNGGEQQFLRQEFPAWRM